jgi:hypothetical protein
MNPQVKGLKVASAVFAFVGLLQLIRLVAGWQILINHREIPLWFSGVAVVVLAWLSWWLGRLAARAPLR